jgi:hypothetical protein
VAHPMRERLDWRTLAEEQVGVYRALGR